MPRRNARSNPTLREFHALGLRVEQACHEVRGARSTYGALKQLAAKWSLSLNMLHKAREFARQYPSQAKLHSICQLGQSVGKPLTKTHVIHLTTVKTQHRRDQLAKRAARQSWTAARLLTEIHKTRPKRTFGGAHPKIPNDPVGVNQHLYERSQQWLRFVKQLRLGNEAGRPLTKLSPAMRTKLTAAERAVEKLRDALDEPIRRKSTRRRQPTRRSRR